MGGTAADIDLTTFFKGFPEETEIAAASADSNHVVGDTVELKSVRVKAYDAFVIKLYEESAGTTVTVSIALVFVTIIRLFF